MKDIDDKYTKILGEKLGQFREEPPEGMFERIEQTLLASGAAAPKQAEEPVVAPVVPLWRRPLFKGAVATLVAASLAFGLFVGLKDRTAEVGADILAENPNVLLTHNEQPEETPVEIIEEEREVAPIVTVAESKGEGVLVAMVPLSEQSEEPLIAESQEQEQQSEQSAVSKSREPRKVSVKGEKRERRSREELEEYWRKVIEEEPRERGVAHPAEVAIYTAGLGLNRGDVQMNNLAHSQLLVNEQHQLGGGSYMGPMMAQQKKSTNLHHSMPLTLGVTVSYSLTDWLAVDSGLLYTSLSSSGESPGEMSNYLLKRSMDYVGIPLALSFYLFDFDRWSIYGRVGITGELCVSSNDKIYMDGALSSEWQLSNQNTASISFDVAAGVSYALWGGLGLFGEVGGSYWSAPENYPENYRTLHPLNLSTRFGVRFTFN